MFLVIRLSDEQTEGNNLEKAEQKLKKKVAEINKIRYGLVKDYQTLVQVRFYRAFHSSIFLSSFLREVTKYSETKWPVAKLTAFVRTMATLVCQQVFLRWAVEQTV